MGAWNRLYENRIERELARKKTKGVRDHPVPTPGAHPSANGKGDDLREQISPLGLREYWYPAMPAKKVGRKPLFWVMLGQELVFFRDTHNRVAALTDVCPHRGASLSEGDSFYNGFVTCPYHGATFDGQGECAAFLTEGPDSTMPGKLRAKSYPTRVLKGWVFVWMGAGKPAPMEEDLPPELFEPNTLVLSTYTYWQTNWLVAIENHSDSHNCFFVHRNSLLQILSGEAGRPRTPVGPRAKMIEDRALHSVHPKVSHYEEKHGTLPYQMYYPGVDGVWPLHTWRRLWKGFFKKALFKPRPYDTVEEWNVGHHLPSVVRSRLGGLSMYTRYAVPVEANLSRIIYFHSHRPTSTRDRLREIFRFYSYFNWLAHYNFSGQDNGAASPCRFWTPEYLSPTDSQVIMLRRMIVEKSRDALRKAAAVSTNGQAKAPAGDAKKETESALPV